MKTEEALRRVTEAVDALCRSLYGRLGELESRLGRGSGYISRMAKSPRLTMRRLLSALEAARVEPASFFARAYDIRPEPETFLRDLDRPGEECRIFDCVARTAKKLETEAPPAPSQTVIAQARLVELSRSSRSDQRKRLRTTKKFQTPRFLREYLLYLDELRYDKPSDAELLSRTVAEDVVLLVPASRRERVELYCGALGVFASANRLLGNLTTAVRAILLGLELARRYGFEVEVARLLQRGAYLLSDHGLPGRALGLLEKAQIVYGDLGRETDVGRVLVDRGIMLGAQGRLERSIAVFKNALELLPHHEERANRLAASHGIAVGHRQLGNLDTADRWLDEVLETACLHGGVVAAKLLWLKGEVLRDKEDLAGAEELLLAALKKFTTHRCYFDCAFVSLQLASVFFQQGKQEQGLSLVTQMPALLSRFKGNKLAQSALLRLVKTGLTGEVSQELLDQTAEKLRQSAAKQRRALPGA